MTMRSCAVLEDEKVGCLIWEFYTGDRIFDGSGWVGGGMGEEEKTMFHTLHDSGAHN